MVFGQVGQVFHRWGFRRVDTLSAKTRRLFKRTGDSTARTLLDQKEAAATAPPPEPKAWRDTWLRAPPNDMELMIAAQVGRPTIDPEIAMLHEEERNVWRAGSALFRDQQLQLQEELQQQQKWMWHRPAPPARRAPPQAPPASGGGTTAQAGCRRRPNRSHHCDPQHAVGRRRQTPTPQRSPKNRLSDRAPCAAAAAALRTRLPPPVSARGRLQRSGGGGGGTSPRSAVLDQPEPPSVSRSLRVREDLRSLLYDVQAAKAAEERRKADAESEALERALERARHASSSCTGEASAPAPSMHLGATRRAPPTRSPPAARRRIARLSGSFTPRPSAAHPRTASPRPLPRPPSLAVRAPCGRADAGAASARAPRVAVAAAPPNNHSRGRSDTSRGDRPCAGEAARAGAAPGAARRRLRQRRRQPARPHHRRRSSDGHV